MDALDKLSRKLAWADSKVFMLTGHDDYNSDQIMPLVDRLQEEYKELLTKAIEEMIDLRGKK